MPAGAKHVVLLKKDDCRRNDGKVFVPNTIEMAQIKKPNNGQFKTNVQFSKDMTVEMVRQKLQETFPNFDLNGRFSCAAVRQDSITFQFHGAPCIWDGRTIRRNITGNSVLYIVMEEDQQCSVEADNSHQVALNDIGMQLSTLTSSEENATVSVQNSVHSYSEVYNVLHDSSVHSTEGNFTVPQDQEEEQQMSDSSPDSSSNYSLSDIITTSGISENDLHCSQDDLSLSQWTLEDVPVKIYSITPERVSLKGGYFCCFKFNRPLPRNIQIGYAIFGPWGTVDLQRWGNDSLAGTRIPPANQSGLVTVIVKSNFGITLGEIDILYEDDEEVFLQRIVHEQDLQIRLLKKMTENAGIATGVETQNSGLLGFKQPVEVLRLLVYAAAKSGGQQFLEMVLSSSAGRAVFDTYKDSLPLPEVIAKDHGNDETARYLEDVTERFSEDIRTGGKYSDEINWPELINAAEAAKKKPGFDIEKESYQSERNAFKDAGYLGDVETSLSESSEQQSSDSEDGIRKSSSKDSSDDEDDILQEGVFDSPKLNNHGSKVYYLFDICEVCDTDLCNGDNISQEEDTEVDVPLFFNSSKPRSDKVEKVSDFLTIQTGSNWKPFQVQSCKWFRENCHTSSDEESYSVTKIQEVEAATEVDSAFELKGKLDSKMIYSPMPVIPKRGCLNSSRYILLITELHDLQDKGDFVAHEQIVQKQLAKRSSGDVDMEASLQIEHAMALYFQNNVKDAKKILKFVLKQEPRLKNPGILTGRALNLLTAVYKRQGKFGNAMTCVQRATSALEHQDSREDKAELYHSYGALLNSLPAVESTKEEAYKSYELAYQYTSDLTFKGYLHFKMAYLLLNSLFKAVSNDSCLCKEDVIKAKRHLYLIEFNMALRRRIQLLNLRYVQYFLEQIVAMGMGKAEEVTELIHKHEFELVLDSAKKQEKDKFRIRMIYAINEL